MEKWWKLKICMWSSSINLEFITPLKPFGVPKGSPNLLGLEKHPHPYVLKGLTDDL